MMGFGTCGGTHSAATAVDGPRRAGGDGLVRGGVGVLPAQDGGGGAGVCIALLALHRCIGASIMRIYLCACLNQHVRYVHG